MQVELKTITKIISTICGIIIIIMAITRFASLNLANPREFILTVHFIILGSILVLSEFTISYVLRNFGLLKSLFGRGLYTIFLGTIMLTTSEMFQLAVSIILIVIGVIYLMLSCKEKSYEPVQNPVDTASNNKDYKKAISLNSNEPSIK